MDGYLPLGGVVSDYKPLAVVLGGGGFIGSNLVKRLVQQDRYKVVAVDVDWPKYRQECWEGADQHFADLTDITHAEEAVQNAEVVFHLAADMGGVEYFHSNADFTAAVYNARITQNVLAAIGRQRGTRLVYASSACAAATEHQYLQGYAPKLSEKDLYWGTPDQLYGAEKRFGAYMCERAPFDARVAIFHTIYGPYQEHEGIRMKFPSAVVRKALAARETGEIELFGDGSQLRSYLYIDDALDRLLSLANMSYNPGPMMIGSEYTASCIEVARLALHHAGAYDAEVKFNLNNKVAPTGVLGRNCDMTKCKNLFGRKDETSLGVGLKRMMKWIEEVM